MSGTHKTYEKSNNAIRFAAKKAANHHEGETVDDDEIVRLVQFELGRKLEGDLQRRVCIRAYREAVLS